MLTTWVYGIHIIITVCDLGLLTAADTRNPKSLEQISEGETGEFLIAEDPDSDDDAELTVSLAAEDIRNPKPTTQIRKRAGGKSFTSRRPELDEERKKNGLPVSFTPTPSMIMKKKKEFRILDVSTDIENNPVWDKSFGRSGLGDSVKQSELESESLGEIHHKYARPYKLHDQKEREHFMHYIFYMMEYFHPHTSENPEIREYYEGYLRRIFSLLDGKSARTMTSSKGPSRKGRSSRYREMPYDLDIAQGRAQFINYLKELFDNDPYGSLQWFIADYYIKFMTDLMELVANLNKPRNAAPPERQAKYPIASKIVKGFSNQRNFRTVVDSRHRDRLQDFVDDWNTRYYYDRTPSDYAIRSIYEGMRYRDRRPPQRSTYTDRRDLMRKLRLQKLRRQIKEKRNYVQLLHEYCISKHQRIEKIHRCIMDLGPQTDESSLINNRVRPTVYDQTVYTHKDADVYSDGCWLIIGLAQELPNLFGSNTKCFSTEGKMPRSPRHDILSARPRILLSKWMAENPKVEVLQRDFHEVF